MNEELKNRAIQVRDEKMSKRNTALRVGGLLLDMIEQLPELPNLGRFDSEAELSEGLKNQTDAGLFAYSYVAGNTPPLSTITGLIEVTYRSRDRNNYVYQKRSENGVTFTRTGSYQSSGDWVWTEWVEETGIDENLIAKVDEMYAALFPVTMTVSGGGVYELGTIRDITVSWTIQQNGVPVVPDSISVNGTPVPVDSNSYTIQGVTESMTISVVAESTGYSLMKLVQVYFVGRSYYGIIDLGNANVNDFDATDLEDMDSVVKNTKAYTYNGITMADKNIVYAYPRSMGELSSIKDANGFQYIGSYTRVERAYNDVDYWVYILTEPATVTAFTQVFS